MLKNVALLMITLVMIFPMKVANGQETVLRQCGLPYACESEKTICMDQYLKFTRAQFQEFIKTHDFQGTCTLLYSSSTSYEAICKVNCIEVGEICRDDEGKCQPIRPEPIE